MPCPFCSVAPERVLLECATAVAISDGFPVSGGHTLVLPKRHVGSVYDLCSADQVTIWEFVGYVRSLLIERYRPDGFNIGINDGFAAGQTIEHAHIHVIPRYTGDVPDPRGGIRWIVAEKAQYWKD